MDPLNFYEKLFQSGKFCTQLGRLLLGFNKLEVLLKKFLRNKSVDVKEKNTFGQLIEKLKEGGFLSSSGEIHFGQLLLIRNYLSHNFYAGFSGDLDVRKKLLASEGLTDMDVDVFGNKLKEEVENVEAYIKTVEGTLSNIKDIDKLL